MKILLLGSGAREHALAWRMIQDDPSLSLFTAPGNAGTDKLGTNLPFAATDVEGLLAWAALEKPDLTVVGPEAPLCLGVVDRFEEAGHPIFGPARHAARLEGSKAFTKAFLLKHKLPTAPGASFIRSKEAQVYLESRTAFPQVVKADGLAAGKGVIIARDLAEAQDAVRRIMDERIFGEAGQGVVIEDFLPGREMSVHVLVGGKSHVVLPISQDHKRLLDHDEGANTGGMGAYAPAPFATPEIMKQVEAEIVLPVLAGFQSEAIEFRGILYIGLIWAESGPQILEFNVRGGDPETQVLLPLIETPLVALFQSLREGKLESIRIAPRHAVTVVMAAPGYPDQPDTGAVIHGLEAEMPGTFVFHGGTKLNPTGEVVTSGGRVLSVTAWGDTLEKARELAYRRLAKIHFEGCQYRTDIAARLTLKG